MFIKLKISILVFVFCNYIFCSYAQKPNEFKRIDSEQKAYELSVIWKELSYNFGNMDNCPNLDIDSLYRAYIPLVMNTKDDFEYWKMLQRFMSHFNNGHTRISDCPDYLLKQCAYPYLRTVYKNGKIYVENFETSFSDRLKVGDEIVIINNMNALDFFTKEHLPYIGTSNVEYKIHEAQFINGQSSIKRNDEKIVLGIKTPQGIKEIVVYANYYLDNQKFNSEKIWNDLTVKEYLLSQYNIFAIDTLKSFAYIALNACDQNFQNDFNNHYSEIQSVDNLIFDLSFNSGGFSSFADSVLCYLVGSDSIKENIRLMRYNNAYVKAKEMYRSEKEKDIELSDDRNFYLNNTFQKTQYENIVENPVPISLRYKGNVYVIIGHRTGSAAESFVAKLNQNEKIIFLGEKTWGGNVQPLIQILPSGIKFMINTGKLFDFNGVDVSSGIEPDIKIDFSECYQSHSLKELIDKMINIIQECDLKQH